MEEPAVPGEFLATEEEFVPGFGTYLDEGNVYSSNIGNVEKDIKKREVRIRVLTRIPLPMKRGAVAYGRVAQVSDNVAIIDISPMKKGQFVYLPRGLTHVLPVSEVKRGFVKSMKDEFKVGDIVKVKIIEIRPTGVVLTTRSSELGVVKAFCTQCRHPMILKKGKLICPNCGNEERRKLSIEYGKSIH